MYHDAINSLEENASHAVVSPPLMGSCGVLPLTVISTYVPHSPRIKITTNLRCMLTTMTASQTSFDTCPIVL